MEKQNFKKKEKIPKNILYIFGILFLISFVYLVLAAPTVSTVVLNSTSGYNVTSDNLIVWTDQDDNDSIKLVYDWRKDGDSFALLNIPMDGNFNFTLDSTNGEYAMDFASNSSIVFKGVLTTTNDDPIYNATGGYDGKGAYEYDGTGDRRLTLATNSMLSKVGNAMTVVMWVKLLNNDSTRVFYQNWQSQNYRWQIAVGAGNLSLYDETGADDDYSLITNYTFPLNEWVHMGIVAENRSWKLYTNGILRMDEVCDGQGTTPLCGTGTGYNEGFQDISRTSKHYFGTRRTTGFDLHWNGTIDDILVFNKSLSQEQITSLYNSDFDLIVSEETEVGENWSAMVFDIYGNESGIGVLSNNLTILDSPIIASLVLNTTSSYNYTEEDLNGWAIIVPSEEEGTKVIYYWKKFGISNSSLIMPFEYGSNDTFTNDYAYSDPFLLRGVVNDNVIYNATGGFDGHGAYEFEGINGGITIAGFWDAGVGLKGDMTFMVWGKYNNLTGDMNLVTYAGPSESSDDNYLYQLELQSNKNLTYMHEYIAGSNQAFTSTVAADVDSNEWHHYAFVRDVSANTIKFYVDGVKLGSTGTFTNDPGQGENSLFYLGRDVTGEYWNGTLDDVYIYDKVFTEGEIEKYYLNQSNILDKTMTSVDDNWTVCGIPIHNEFGVGDTVCSNVLTVNEGSPLNIDSVILNSSSGTNLTHENLTAYVINLSSGDKAIYDWRKDGNSIAVLNMPFDGGLLAESETKVKDYSSFANNGTVNNGVIYNSAGGYDGKGAYEFDGVNGSIEIDYNQDFNFTDGDGFTVMAWMSPKDLVNNRGDIVSHYRGAVDYRIWDLQIYNGQARFAGCYNGTLNSCVYAYSGVNVNDTNTWYHLVGTWNGTHLQVYVNGVAEDNTPPALANIHSTDNRGIRLGTDTATEWYNGSIDEVMIFNRSLSAQQILALYNNRTDLIVSQETSIGENWYVQVTPNDGNVDGTSVMSNNLIILAEDTCSCPSSANWNINMADYCILNSVCNISGYDLTFYGVGNFTMNSTLYIDEMLNLSSNMTIWMKPDGVVYLGV